MSALHTDVLRRILSAAQSGARRYASHAQPIRPVMPSLPITDLCLPLPEPVTPRLVAMGVDEPSSERISSSMMRIALLFKENLDADFRRRCATLRTQAHCLQDPRFLSILSLNYHAVFSKAIDNWTSYILEDFTPRLLKARQLQQDSIAHRSRRRPFNHSAVPALERFFERNAFPSRLEKYDLASTFNMSYRQIDVWFQNHRTRYRKEGRELRHPIGHNALVDEFEKSVIDVLLPTESLDGDHGDAGGDTDSIQSALSSSVNKLQSAFHLAAPAHAFPSPYPPLCSYDPFPATPEKRGLALPWLRSPQSQSPHTDIPVTVDQLIASFAQLTITDETSSSPSCSPGASIRHRSHAYALGFAIACSRAPHPSLIRRPKRGSRVTCSPGRLAATCKTSNGDSPLQSPVAMDSICQHKPRPRAPIVSSSASSRKKCALPRRVPKHPPLRRTSCTSIAQSASSTSSRANSFTSSTSSSSSISDSEFPLLTPELRPLAMPINDFVPTLTDLEVTCGDPSFIQALDPLSAADLRCSSSLRAYSLESKMLSHNDIASGCVAVA
ncbi:hypothetical protein BD310DRAFT_915887 [Dichomitus squalens]|uniref:Homeobox domain-containing protein n=1 Tax=Dichomitus squalens TaxID=114155 RepID=A0A4Q9Q8J0_9APHY|nr:hypothetical protein BD310DRAFT_915887 [Dichomitus squalens]